MASKAETIEDEDTSDVKEEADRKLDKATEEMEKAVIIEDKKSLKKKKMSFAKKRLSSKSLFTNLFGSKNVGIS